MKAGARAAAADAQARLSALLVDSGVDGLLVVAESALDSDLAPFVGAAHLGEAFLLFPAQGPARLGFLTEMEREEAASTGLELLTPSSLGIPRLRKLTDEGGEFWYKLLSAAFAVLGSSPGRWALAGHPAAGSIVEACSRLAAEGWQWVGGGEILRLWRKFKPLDWLPRIEEPAAGVAAAMRGVAAMLAAAEERAGDLILGGEPLSIARLRAAVRLELAGRGLSEPHGNILAAGRAAGVPHTQGDSGHVLRAGEPLVVDLYPRGEIFADCTRTLCVGAPSEAFRDAYEAVLAALTEAHERCRPGVRGWELQASACDLFEARGYATPRSDPKTVTGYVHGIGHGVGYELHEYPSFRQHAGVEGLLEVGDLLTLEPGLYDPARGYGVRLEDMCFLGPDGLVNLTPLPYDWDPRA
ncbi:MAG: M24 family metallopeptidase, partial [Acidobacteria bacterium]|nr:M24 family metallopeptidase [Acidobacteriota bacterium]